VRLRTWFARPVLTAVVITAAACGDDHDTIPNTKMDYEGTVTDASDGAPIVGANVHAFTCGFFTCSTTATSTTNAQGRYVLFGECYSNNSLGAHATGYVANTREADCAQGRQVANFALARAP
jgi:hypothetical protein